MPFPAIREWAKPFSRIVRWYYLCFLTNFCYYALLPVVLVILFGLLFFRFGSGFGAHRLVWHDDVLIQMTVGIAMTFVLLQVLAIGHLLWLRDLREHNTGWAAGIPVRGMKTYTSLIGICIAATVLGIVLLREVLILLQDLFDYPIPQEIKEESQEVEPLYTWPRISALLVGVVFTAFAWLLTRLRVIDNLVCSKLAPRDAAAGITPPNPGDAAAINGRGSRRWYWTAWFTLCYFLITLVLSSIGILPAFLLTILLFAIGFRVLMPHDDTPARRLQEFFFYERNRTQDQSQPFALEWVARRRFVYFTLFGLLFFIVVCNVERLSSPVPTVCFLIAGIVVFYGLANYVVGRSMPIAVGILLIAAILGGTSPYNQQFEGLDYSPNKILSLAKQTREDQERQERFDRHLHKYQEREADLEKVLRDKQTVAAGFADIPSLWGVPLAKFDEWQLLRAAVDEFEEEAARIRKDLATHQPEMQRAWQDLEENNRVIAGRLLRQNLSFLQPRDCPNRLLQTHEIDLANAARRHPDLATVAKPKRPVVIIAVSGGGLRAAAWTWLVMRQLEDRFALEGIDFPSHVRIITGASGGMLGAGYYVATLPEPKWDSGASRWSNRGDERRGELDDQYARLTNDCLTPVVNTFVFRDIPCMFSPWPSTVDRGKSLEKSWSRNMNNALDLTFKQLRDREKAGWCPSLVFTPMMIEDGRRLLISNLDMRYPISNDGNRLTDELSQRKNPHPSGRFSVEALEMFRLFPDSYSQFKIATAVRMSASFPYFSPAVSLPTYPRRRVVDAGYYDNFGVSLSAAWLFSGANAAWLEEHASQIFLIQIRDEVGDNDRNLTRIGPDGSSSISRSSEGFVAPIEGLYNARVGSSSFRNDGGLELLSQSRNRLQKEKGDNLIDTHPLEYRDFSVATFEYSGQAALSWHLPQDKRKRLQKTATIPSNSGSEEAPNLNALIDALIKKWKNVSEPAKEMPK